MDTFDEANWTTAVNESSINGTAAFIVFDNITDMATYCQQRPWAPADTAFKWVAFAMAFLVILVGLAGNGLVCYLVTFSAKINSLIDILIMNMAVSDLLTSFLYSLLVVYVLAIGYWPFDGIVCTIYAYLVVVFIQVSTYTMVAISINRYIAVIWPFWTRTKSNHTKSIIFFVWLIPIVSSYPITSITELNQPSAWYKKCGTFICYSTYKNQNLKLVYKEALTTLHVFIPISTLIFTYSSIGVVLWRKKTPGEAQHPGDLHAARSKIKMIRMIKMMVIVVIAFAVSWTPFSTFLKRATVEPSMSLSIWDDNASMWFTLYFLGMSHTCYNPIIYYWMNKDYRQGFKAVFSRVFGLCTCFGNVRRRLLTTQGSQQSQQSQFIKT
ncbi:RYamide receptor-like [Adelges cooleyi]|uniref:RYamide receptor-like n=1 Tax=Adelges cooleyi TaxID=133065 RepID=UPI00217F9CBE|nr:RYamide receptor-like [Adelges cooleyi]